MFGERGLSLAETLVAILVSTIIVLATGLLGLSSFHRRSSSASLSAAASIADQEFERLRPRSFPWPVDQAPYAGLQDGTATWLVDETGATAVGGPYEVRRQIASGPAVGTKQLKRVTVTVQHLTNDEIRTELVTYFRVSN